MTSVLKNQLKQQRGQVAGFLFAFKIFLSEKACLFSGFGYCLLTYRLTDFSKNAPGYLLSHFFQVKVNGMFMFCQNLQVRWVWVVTLVVAVVEEVQVIFTEGRVPVGGS